ncbi:hypothetical protein AAHA92_01590 [Salvia divinorum]|uniref:Uncharacterized protein n=1 Tax=Salvia divinorum TaxID=28513 RepID=A0ABD1IF47_SALDI
MRILSTIDSSSCPNFCGFLVVEAYPKRYSSKIPSDLVLFLGLGFIDCVSDLCLEGLRRLPVLDLSSSVQYKLGI